MNDKLLAALGLCRRAGKLAVGFDAAVIAIEKGAPLALVASDAADRTRRNMARCCEGRAPLAELNRTQQEIEAAVGRRFAVAAVSDRQLARLIEENLEK